MGFLSHWGLTESSITKVEMDPSEIIQSWEKHPDNEGIMSKAQMLLTERWGRFQQGLEMMDSVVIPRVKKFIEQDIQNVKKLEPLLKLIVELHPYIQEEFKKNIAILDESISRIRQIK